VRELIVVTDSNQTNISGAIVTQPNIVTELVDEIKIQK